MADVVVVGGGIGGLVVARRLVLGGLDVQLLEASDRLGGTVAAHTVGGLELDAGAESFATRGDIVGTLARSLRLADEVVRPNPAGAWLLTAAGEAHPLPALSLLGIPGAPLAADVLPILGFGAALRAFSESLLPGTVGANSRTLGELVRRRMGPAVLERLVDPVAGGVHSASPDDLDLDRVAPGLRAALRRTGSLARAVQALRMPVPGAPADTRPGAAVAGIRGGVFRLARELAADLDRFGVDVRLGARVTEVADDHVMVGSDRYDGTVVVAAPGLRGASASAAQPPATRTTIVTLVVDQPELDAHPRGTGVLVTRGAPGVGARALTHVTAKWPWLAERAEGRHVLRLSYADGQDSTEHGSAGHDSAGLESTGQDSTALADRARRDAALLLGTPLPPERVLDTATVTWSRAARVAGPVDGYLVGETAAGTGLAQVVAQAERVAQELLVAARE